MVSLSTCWLYGNHASGKNALYPQVSGVDLNAARSFALRDVSIPLGLEFAVSL